MKAFFLFILLITASTVYIYPQDSSKHIFLQPLPLEDYDYNEDRVVYVKGYFLRVHNEEELLWIKMNEELRRQGRSYETLIDTRSGVCSYILQVYNRTLLDEADIAPLLQIRFIMGNSDIIKFPPYKWIKPIEDLFNSHSSLKSRSDEIINKRIDFPEAGYYKLENDSGVCQIWYVEGWALRTAVQTDYLNQYNSYELGNYHLYKSNPNNSIAAFFMYLFYDIDVIDSGRPPAGFEKWEPEFTAADLDKVEAEILEYFRKWNEEQEEDEDECDE